MHYLFQRKIVSNYITLAPEVLVEEATEVFHGLRIQPIPELEGFLWLHKSKIVQRGTKLVSPPTHPLQLENLGRI